MAGIPVSFAHEGKEYIGTLEEVFGAGAVIGTVWHLMIDRYYWGQLHFTEKGWLFYANTDVWIQDYADYFGEIIMLWYE